MVATAAALAMFDLSCQTKCEKDNSSHPLGRPNSQNATWPTPPPGSETSAWYATGTRRSTGKRAYKARLRSPGVRTEVTETVPVALWPVKQVADGRPNRLELGPSAVPFIGNCGPAEVPSNPVAMATCSRQSPRLEVDTVPRSGPRASIKVLPSPPEFGVHADLAYATRSNPC